MISVILGVGIPILYLAFGSAVWIKVYDARLSGDCKTHRTSDQIHADVPWCDCGLYATFSGLLWPLAGIFLAVWVLMKGTKQPKGTRIGRAQRRVRKMQARIDELQRELGMEP